MNFESAQTARIEAMKLAIQAVPHGTISDIIAAATKIEEFIAGRDRALRSINPFSHQSGWTSNNQSTQGYV